MALMPGVVKNYGEEGRREGGREEGREGLMAEEEPLEGVVAT